MVGTILLCACLPCRAQDPTTEPAPQTQPVASADSIKRSLDQLADADPNLRDEAADKLMQLKREDLPALRQIVQEELPLTPTQMEALPEIVSQVYLAGEPYEAQADAGFLGIETSPVDIASANAPVEEQSFKGILVVRRVSGFCGGRALHNGDVITGFANSPKPGFLSLEAFRDSVKQRASGSIVRLQVLRRGRVREVAVTLDARPIQADLGMGLLQLTQDRQRAFDHYWADNFAPLLKEEVSSAASDAVKN